VLSFQGRGKNKDISGEIRRMMDEERDGRIAGVEYGNTGSVPNFFLISS
jgi:hypothetical protein